MKKNLPWVKIVIGAMAIVLTGKVAHGDGPPALHCDSILLVRNTLDQKSNLVVREAWLRLVTNENYQQIKTQVNTSALTVYGDFSGDYSNFDEKRTQELQQSQYNLQRDESLSILSSIVPPAALTEWGKCIHESANLAGQPWGLTSIAEDVDKTGATLSVRWDPAPGLGNLTIKKVSSSGIKDADFKFSEGEVFAPGDIPVIIRRASPGDAMRGTVTGTAGGVLGIGAATYSTKFYIVPPEVPVPPPVGVHLQPDPYYLSDHPEDFVDEEWVMYEHISYNGVWYGPNQKVVVGGVTYARAIGMPAICTDAANCHVAKAQFKIPKGARHFNTDFGLAESDGVSYGEAKGSIFIDGIPVWNGAVSKASRSSKAAIAIPDGATIIKFEVDPLGTDWSDHIVWGNPYYIGN